jgi:cytochrome c oxidase subunit 3
MGTTVSEDVKVKPAGIRRGAGGAGDDRSGGRGGGGPEDWPPGWSRDDAIQPRKYRIGIWVALASILMMFVALTSAYIVRQIPQFSGQTDWVFIEMPGVLWLNTGIILASSVTMEMARRALRLNQYSKFNRWLLATMLLGVAFLVGQLYAWRQLVEQGIYVNNNPHSSFFYVLTSLHGIHLLGGVIALAFVTAGALRLRIGFKKRAVVNVVSTYWHFMDALWIYLFVLLFFWK